VRWRMANTFSQIYIQTVFAVSNRQSLIKPEFKEDIYKYVTGIVKSQPYLPNQIAKAIRLNRSRDVHDLRKDPTVWIADQTSVPDS